MSADISNFEEETEAYKLPLRIQLQEILATVEWSAQLYRLWPLPTLQPSPLISYHSHLHYYASVKLTFGFPD